MDYPIIIKQIFGFDIGLSFYITVNPFRWKFLQGKYFLPFKYVKDEGVEEIIGCPIRAEEFTIFLFFLRISFVVMLPPTRAEFEEAENWKPEFDYTGNVFDEHESRKYGLEKNREAFVELVKIDWKQIATKIPEEKIEIVLNHWKEKLGGQGIDLRLAITIGKESDPNENILKKPSEKIINRALPVIVSMQYILRQFNQTTKK